MTSTSPAASRWLCLAIAAGMSWAVADYAAAQPPAAPADAEPASDKSGEKTAEAAPRHRANRLAKETSPYLLLHAHNPVDWHGWGDEALAKAAKEKKLIFLSIGYSSCYWCHVMERESFMDEEIARFLNEHFVCIKVDREERPDIDEIYMTALQVMGRRGGWPLTMFLTPDARPFFGGTYFPPRDKAAPGAEDNEDAEAPRITGLATLLKLVDERWKKSPADLSATADQVSAAVKRALRGRPLVAVEPPAAGLADEVEESLAGQYDEQHGGFRFSEANPSQPKFPEPQNLMFLIDRVDREGSQRAKEMLVGTLDAMACGGIRDHLGGGFHRYSTDRFWRIPHFEKMLYDNGQLASVYAEAFRITDRVEYRQVTEEILAFVDRELTSPEGGFYAALDAETDAEEGRYYVWTEEELKQSLDPDEFDLLADAYGVKAGSNFEDRSVLVLPRALPAVAAARRLPPARLEEQLAAVRQKLLAVRSERPRPLTDTKMLASWNGLMIRGFADAGRIFERPAYVETAARAANMVLDRLQAADGRLLHSYTAGKAALNAYLDDYAFLVDGLIALHRATGEARWLNAADTLTQKQLELFWDAEAGGFFFTSHDHEALLARSKDPIDTVTPSGNAVSIGNLVYLALAADKPEYLERAEKTVLAFGPWLAQSPTGLPRTVIGWTALQRARQPQEAPPE